MVYLLLVVFMVSLVLTRYLRNYALTRQIIDIPNHRSSHAIPTPRGGGVAFIIALTVGVPCLSAFGFNPSPTSMALVVAGLIVAAIGFLDDRGSLPPGLRLLGHFGASVVALYWLGGMPSIHFFGYEISSGLGLNILAVIYLTWLLNLYNFMDGIDGLAAIEAITVCLGSACILWLSGYSSMLGVPLLVVAAVAGFLWWNFPPARIFMGDAGSGFLGLVIGILSINTAHVNPSLFWCWLILLGVFVVDATVTLFVRLFKRLPIYQAHCDHAYQHAVRYCGNHLTVSFSVFMINVIWLFPMAIFVAFGYLESSTGLLLSYIPLIILTGVFKAGKKIG